MLCFEFSSIFNLFSPWRDNNSYGYYSKVSDSAGKLTFNYGDVFDEYTNADANISCSGKKTCYVGCTCKSGWNGKKTISSSGSNLTTSGAGADLSGSYTIADSGSAPKTTASTSGLNISTMATGDSCTISVTDPRYSVTCTKASTYDCAGVCGGSAYFKCTSGSTSSSCSSGYYSVNVGKQKCTSGSATNSTSCYTCSQCTYTCPTSGYSINTTSCGSGYTLKTESATKVNSSCPAKTCGKCEQNYYTVTFKKVFNSSCDGTGAASGYSGISGAKVGSTNVSDSSNTATVSNVVSGTSWSWTPGDGMDTTDYNISLVSVTDNGSGSITSNKTISATYKCTKNSSSESWPDYYTVGILADRVDRCTVKISAAINSAPSYKGSVTFGINYWIRSCGMHDVKDEDLKGKSLTLNLNSGYTQHAWTFTKCTTDSSSNCTLYVEAIGNASVAPSSYNGKKVKIEIQNQAN